MDGIMAPRRGGARRGEVGGERRGRKGEGEEGAMGGKGQSSWGGGASERLTGWKKNLSGEELDPGRRLDPTMSLGGPSGSKGAELRGLIP